MPRAVQSGSNLSHHTARGEHAGTSGQGGEIRSHVWTPGSGWSAPLVIVSAEAACMQKFLE